MRWILVLLPLALLACDVKLVETMDFSNVRTKDLPQGWIASQSGKKNVGIWEVDEKKRVAIIRPRGYTASNRNLFFTNRYFFQNGGVEATIYLNGDGGVIFRAKNRKNYYDVRITKNKILVERVKDGKVELVTQKKISLDPSQPHRLKVIYCDRDLEIFLDDKPIWSLKGILEPSTGGVGVVATGQSKTKFDNIKIYR